MFHKGHIPSDPAGLFSEGGKVINLHIHRRLSNDTQTRYNFGNAKNRPLKHWGRIAREGEGGGVATGSSAGCDTPVVILL